MDVKNYVKRNFGIIDPLSYANVEEKIFERQAAENGYERISTFFSDLSIAEWCEDENGVQETYDKVVNEWIHDVKMFAEFVISLNWKSWEWAARQNDKLGKLYSDLYYKAHYLALDTFKGEDAEYYFNVTD